MADKYRGDLEGTPARSAAFMRCGVCLCGDRVGVDLLDRNGKTIAHGHLDVAAADDFWRQYGEAIVDARNGGGHG